MQAAASTSLRVHTCACARALRLRGVSADLRRCAQLSRWLVVLVALGGGLAQASDGVQSRELSFDAQSFHVVEIDLARDTLELHWRDTDGNPFASIDRLREWGTAHGRALLFAANAGIYDQQYRPLGLHVENGQMLRPLNTASGTGRSGNFALQPNGVFYVDRLGHAGVVETSRWRERGIDARLATQSGPMLVVDGAINARFDAASDSRKWRSGVCAKTPRQVLFAVSSAPVSFHAFARLFRDGLGCRDALYLDGTLSQVYVRGEGFAGAPALMLKPYAGIFAVFTGAAQVD